MKNAKKHRQESAVLRAEQRKARTPLQQLKRLDRLLGPSCGAKKERARLLQMIKDKENNE